VPAQLRLLKIGEDDEERRDYEMLVGQGDKRLFIRGHDWQDGLYIRSLRFTWLGCTY
jgi:hypothetical protein